MKKKYHTIRTVPKYNKKILETEAKPILITQAYMTANSPGFIQTLQ